MSKNAAIEIETQIAGRFRRQAAALFYEAFQRKLRALVPSPPQGIRLVEGMIVPQNALVAIRADRCVGLAGLHHERSSFLKPSLPAFVATIGLLRGFTGWIAFRLLDQPLKRGDLRIESLAVEAAERGQGIGTILLAEAYQLARQRGFSLLSLEVVDTNPDARRLYEREGFRPVKTTRYPYLKRIAGFSASTLMVKDIL